MMRFAKLCFGISLGLILTLYAGCGDDAANSSVTGAFPDGFAVSSPTAVASRNLVKAPRGITVTSSADRAAKKELLSTLFAASTLADCRVSITLVNAGNSPCYGPSMDYTDHPGASTPNSGSFPGGDTGIWEATDSASQACAAAQLNSRVNGSASYADAGLFGTASLLCAARVTSAGSPAVGSSVDLTSSMTDLISINATAVTVTAATLSREADTTGGFPVYVSEIVGTSGTTTYTLRMKHIPTGTGSDINETFQGKVSVKIAANDGTKPGNCSTSSATGHTIATSVEYERSSATAEKFLVKDAQFCGSDADPFVSATNFTVDHSKTVGMSTPKGWGNNANFLAASLDPSTLVGNYAYAWQAGAGDSNARALSVNLAASGTDLNGTAFFGFANAISAGSFDGSITKMICAWTGPGSNHTGVSEVQRQTMTKSASDTFFSSVSANITYDPVNSCESSSAGFEVEWTGVSGSPMARTANTTTKDLVALSTVASSFTAPTAPTSIE